MDLRVELSVHLIRFSMYCIYVLFLPVFRPLFGTQTCKCKTLNGLPAQIVNVDIMDSYRHQCMLFRLLFHEFLYLDWNIAKD